MRRIAFLLILLLFPLFGFSAIEITDEASLQRALDTEDKITLPAREIVLTRSLSVTRHRQTIKGRKGSVLRILKPSNILQVKSGIQGLTVRGVTFCGVGDKRKASYLIYVEHGSKDLLITRCTFDGGTGGVMVDYEGSNASVTHCTFRNMVYIPGAGLAAGGNYAAGGAGGYGVVFQHINNSHGIHAGVKRGKITHCLFESTVIRHAIYVQSSEDILIERNTILGTTRYNSKKAMDDLLTVGLTDTQIDALDVTSHTTVADVAICLRGGRNITIRKNKATTGIGFLRGTPDIYGNKATNVRLQGNTITGMEVLQPHYKIIDPSFAAEGEFITR